MPPKVWGPTRLAGFLANLNSPTGVEHSDWSRSQGTSLLSIDCKDSGEIWSRFYCRKGAATRAGPSL